MAGNVREWCLNKHEDPMDDRIDRSNDWRVLRGGSWFNESDYCRAAYRNGYSPVFRGYLIGFRLLRPPSSDH
jgi:formylglycine-generating enzyme required for sulfatase activity